MHYGKEEAAEQEEDTHEDFFTLVVMVFKTGCILVTVEMKLYIIVNMPSVFFVAEASPSVQFVTASLGNVVM